MIEYLAYIDKVGETNDGKLIYRFDFTKDKDVVWGDFWNIAPSSLVPNLNPDEKSLSKHCKAILPYEMFLAKSNSCFSMQDCIDGILPLCFPDITEKFLNDNEGNPIFFNFGEDYDTVKNKLSINNINFFDEVNVENGKSVSFESIETESDTDSYDDDLDF